MFLSSVKPNLDFCFLAPSSPHTITLNPLSTPDQFSRWLPSSPLKHKFVKSLNCFAKLKNSGPKSDSNSGQHLDSDAKTKTPRQKAPVDQSEGENPDKSFPATIPKKPRRGRRSEAAAVEDFVRGSLERTFTTIREQNSELLENKESVLKDRVTTDEDDSDGDIGDGEDENGKGGEKKKKMVVDEESSDWPLDADVGWGIRASEYFEQHPIRNIVGEDGVEIDWEGELDDTWVKEINCLEWETFAFHPSPLIVLVFERYNRATDNWKILKELEKAIKVYWSSKDRLPPRAVKLDINIEKDLAYALKVRKGPQILFLRGNKILYREEDIRRADELVQMIAHFYYKAKKPSFICDGV